ncbi:MAG: hypothetical protein ACRDSF_26045, partial [Pseudonocardiaceae bacterium]
AGLPPSRATAHQPKTRGSRCPEHATPHARSTHHRIQLLDDPLTAFDPAASHSHPTPRTSGTHPLMLNREQLAPFVIVADAPGGGLVVPVVSARVAAQAARHLSQYCPDIRATWRVNPQAGPGPVMVWGCARPPTGEPWPDPDTHTFLLTADDSLPTVWTAICGQPIPGAQFEALDPSMGRPCQSCQQRLWTALHPEHTSLPARSPGQHMHPQLRRPPSAGRSGAGGGT